LVLLTLFCVGATSASAQGTFFDRYEKRVESTLVNQPHWATPLVTVNSRVEQGFRSDFVRQTSPSGAKTWNLGNTKGLQFIPLPRLEIRVSPPPFFLHYDSKAIDGFGDIAFRAKVRIYGSNEQHHNAIVTAYMGASIPTGKNNNGSCCAVLTPTLELGKGFGKLAMTTSGGGSLPVSNTVKLGRSIVWNNAIQYHVARFVWIENEFNATFYKGGSNDGKQQTFDTPGIFLSRLPLVHGNAGAPDLLSLTLGAGEQIALTHFNTYNHSPIFTGRLRF
jgi:hypothetical protein